MSATDIQIVLAAKKKHRCSYCGHIIQVGETYKRYRYFDGGDAGTVKIHPECLLAFHELSSHDQAEGFDMGESPRGCNCGFDKNCARCAANAEKEKP
ncbi:hypothetical protein GN109_05635 [Collimonas pratensis]|uniref:hypothetical protein n=1 Tax=Collimonas pratensis TaxID=279113 RepID=UPI00143D8E88|nr:hypothetical protein [Collimonas pratensis]NKI68895.1 hypothetical protein [Collimonas pratensis]